MKKEERIERAKKDALKRYDRLLSVSSGHGFIEISGMTEGKPETRRYYDTGANVLPEDITIEEFAVLAKEIYGENAKVGVMSSSYPEEHYLSVSSRDVYAAGKTLLHDLSKHFRHKLLDAVIMDYDRSKPTNIIYFIWKKGTYLDCRKQYIGESFYGELILAGRSEGRLVLNVLKFNMGGRLYAYYVDNPFYEIPDDFKPVCEYEGELRIFDYASLAALFSGEKIRVLKNGDEECIIQVIRRQFYGKSK